MMYISEYPVCPRCESENYTDQYASNVKSEFQRCYDCGYSRKYRMIKGNSEYRYTKTDGTTGVTTEIYLGEEILIDNPFGTFKLNKNNGDGQTGTLETKKDYEEFVSEIVSETNQKHNIKAATVSMLIDGKIVKETIFPKSV